MKLVEPITAIDFRAEQRPILVVAIDAEEEFDWRTFSPTEISVENIAVQQLAHRAYERHRIRPIYLVDYPVADQPAGSGPLLEMLQDGACDIGAQLHPWVNPPLGEKLDATNSFPGNLDVAIEQAKLTRLTDRIEDAFGRRPTDYRAGRYGFGPHTTDLLAALDYQTDLTFLTHTDLRRDGGPDFRAYGPQPFWFGPTGDLLEIPVTIGMPGLLSGLGPLLHGPLTSPLGRSLHLPGLFARSGLLNRVRLSPEGVPVDEAMAVTRWLYARGQRIFVMSYHTSSLLLGKTPFVRTQDDRARFLDWIEQFTDFFMGEMNGLNLTPGEVYQGLRRQKEQGPALLS